jgi:hypothetical protein
MEIIDINLNDKERARIFPVAIYLPETINQSTPIVIFGPGYQGQEDLANPNIKPVYKEYNYLAEFFIKKGYCFISIQHDILGDNDGLETIDPKLIQHEARKHLYIRGEQNIFFTIKELTVRFPLLNFNKFIIAGHSNGGDIAKYFANNNPKRISVVITLDARRCIIEPQKNLKLLMFEADDTSTDQGVIPDQGTEQNPKRTNLEWVIIKPKNATHIGYNGSYITEELKQAVFRGINWVLADD